MRRTTARVLPVVVLTGLMAGGVAAPAAFADPAARVHWPHISRPGTGVLLPAADCGPNGGDACPTAAGPSEGALPGGVPAAPAPDLALPGAPQDSVPQNSVPRDAPTDDPLRDPLQDPAVRLPPRAAPSPGPSQGQVPRDPSASRAPSGTQDSGGPSRDNGSQEPSRGQASRDPGHDTAAGRTSSPDGGPRDIGASCADPSDRRCVDHAVRHGVRAGAGGAFTTSLPALVAGGLLIAAAFGAAVHRVWWWRRA
ncbi:hypothetical protein [Streptomyces thermoalcalitolerans]|uniref:Uncharacterized protein n=1 Tax=Streptomyces thermoalcalitolerans TaxID=65605 RepID=A0ABP3YYM5_9ACTN